MFIAMWVSNYSKQYSIEHVKLSSPCSLCIRYLNLTTNLTDDHAAIDTEATIHIADYSETCL